MGGSRRRSRRSDLLSDDTYDFPPRRIILTSNDGEPSRLSSEARARRTSSRTDALATHNGPLDTDIRASSMEMRARNRTAETILDEWDRARCAENMGYRYTKSNVRQEGVETQGNAWSRQYYPEADAEAIVDAPEPATGAKKVGRSGKLESMLRRLNGPKIRHFPWRQTNSSFEPEELAPEQRARSQRCADAHVVDKSKSSSDIRTMMPGHLDEDAKIDDMPFNQTLTIRRISRWSTGSYSGKRKPAHKRRNPDLEDISPQDQGPSGDALLTEDAAKQLFRAPQRSFLLRWLYETGDHPTPEEVAAAGQSGRGSPGNFQKGWAALKGLLFMKGNKVADASKRERKFIQLPDMKLMIGGRRSSVEHQPAEDMEGLSSISADELRKRPVVQARRMRSTSRTVMTLAPFVPKLLKDIIRNLDFGDRTVGFSSTQEASQTMARRLSPRMTTFKGAVMVADITGFTNLTELLSKKGTAGLEILTKCINNFFSQVIDLVFEYDGDVTKFAGDSLIVAFYPNKKEENEDGGLKGATLRCVQCAHAIAEALGHMRMLPTGKIELVERTSDSQSWQKGRSMVHAAFAFRRAGSEVRSRFRTGGSAPVSMAQMATPSQGSTSSLGRQAISKRLISLFSRKQGGSHQVISEDHPFITTNPTSLQDLSHILSGGQELAPLHSSGSWSILPRMSSNPTSEGAPRATPALARSSTTNTKYVPTNDFRVCQRTYGSAAQELLRGHTMGAHLSSSTSHPSPLNPHSPPQDPTPVGMQKSVPMLGPNRIRLTPIRGRHALRDSDSGRLGDGSSSEGDLSANICSPGRDAAADPGSQVTSSPEAKSDRDRAPMRSSNSWGPASWVGDRVWDAGPQKIAAAPAPSGKPVAEGAASSGTLTGESSNLSWMNSRTSQNLQGWSEDAGDRQAPGWPQVRRLAQWLGAWLHKSKARQGSRAAPTPKRRQRFSRGSPQHSAKSQEQSPPPPCTPDRSEKNVCSQKSRGDLNYSKRETATEVKQDALLEEDIGEFRLSLKVMVGAGTVCVFQVGGQEERSPTDNHSVPRWEFFIGDRPNTPGADESNLRPPIRQIASVECFANAGDVIVSPEVIRVLGDTVTCEELEGGAGRVESLNSLENQPRNPASAKVAVALHAHAFSFLTLPLQAQCAAILRMHVLDSVRQRIEAGHLDFVNEIRRLTVLFMGFPSLSERQAGGSGAERPIGRVQHTVEIVQRRMREFDGSFLQFRCDEKGFLAICAFGLPGRTHQDNCSRAVRAAIKIVKSMRETADRACVGITTGDLLCACVGSVIRAEYTVFGDAINLSARLMQKAKMGLGDVLCDGATFEGAKRKANFVPLEPLKVKGKREALTIYRVEPLARRARRARSTAYMQGLTTRPLVGRENVLRLVQRKISELVEEEGGGAVILKGDAGMGKSKIITELLGSDFQGIYRVHMFYGAGDAAHKSQPLYPWKCMFQDMFAHDRMLGQILKAAVGSVDRPVSGIHRRGYRRKKISTAVTKMGRTLSSTIEDYDPTWREFIARALDLPMEVLPIGEHAKSVTTIHSPSKSTPERPITGTGKALLSVASFLESVQVQGRPAKGRREGGASTSYRRRSRSLKNLGRSMSMDESALRSVLRGTRDELEPAQRVRSKSVEIPQQKASDDSMVDRRMRLMAPMLKGEKSESSPIQSDYSSDKIDKFMSGFTNARGQRCSYEGTVVRKLKEIEMTHELKTQRLLELLVEVCDCFIRLYGPVVVLLEDLQHFDTMSWTLLNTMVEELSDGFLTISTLRPNGGSLSYSASTIQGKEILYEKSIMALKYLERLVWTEVIDLQGFNLEQARKLIDVVAEGQEVSNEIVRAVWEKTGGVPMYIEHITTFLKQKEMLCITPNMGSTFTADSVLTDFIRNTVTIHHVLIDQVDRLRPVTHLTLKVAATVGSNITVDVLHKIYPYPTSEAALRRDLVGLGKAGFLRRDMNRPLELWQFSTMVARDVVYELIPHFQRRGLHAKTAEVLEAQQGGAVPMTTIAYHWSQACLGVEITDWRRAFRAAECWEKAAVEATEKSARVEALRLYQKAVDIAEKLLHFPLQVPAEGGHQEASETRRNASNGSGMGFPSIATLKRAEWERRMAGLYLEMHMSGGGEVVGREQHAKAMDNITRHAFRALDLLGAPSRGEQLIMEEASCSCLEDFCGRVPLVRPPWGSRPSATSVFSGSVKMGGSELSSPRKVGSSHRHHSLDELTEISLVLDILVTSATQQGAWDLDLLQYCRTLVEFFNMRVKHTDASPFLAVEERLRTEYRIHQRSLPQSFITPRASDMSKDTADDPYTNGEVDRKARMPGTPWPIVRVFKPA